MRGTLQPVAGKRIWNSALGRGVAVITATFIASTAVHLVLTDDPQWAWSTRNALLVTLLVSVSLRRNKRDDDGR